MKHQLSVGVSIFVRKGEQSLWENGIFQNCIFLVLLLMKSPRVAATYLVAGGGEGGPADAKFLADSPVPIIDLATAMDTLDVMIEMSAQMSAEWIVKFQSQGGKVASMRVGNDYVIDIERMVFNKPQGLLINGAPYNAVWTIPEYESTCVPYFGSTFRAPVTLVPHLWSPVVVEKALSKLGGSRSLDYQPGKKRWRVGMVEPNVCMVKTSYIPMLCCEVAHRSNPQLLEKMVCYNTLHLKDQPYFNGFANSLDVVRHGLGTFEARYPIYDILGVQVDALVCHHWENGQNYVYYEALYGGYPLVHNSHLLDGCGYRYHGFDCEEGGAALCHALQVHDQNLDDYRQRARTFLATLDPEGERNVAVYTQALEALFEQGA